MTFYIYMISISSLFTFLFLSFFTFKIVNVCVYLYVKVRTCTEKGRSLHPSACVWTLVLKEIIMWNP